MKPAAARFAHYRKAIEQARVLIVGDVMLDRYWFGDVERISPEAPVPVDPKGEDFARYRGATVLTPNRAEFRHVAGSWRNEAELAEKAQAMRAQLALEALLITRSEEGMSLYTDAGAQHIPAQAREVFDVSG